MDRYLGQHSTNIYIYIYIYIYIPLNYKYIKNSQKNDYSQSYHIYKKM